ncbi:hypothetical protein CFR73_09575 [Novacetimonas maltaceti]|uniref:Uncharacterized protein n=1 Tax=Novacetimonas maltaceti TaxID=1203393 RepID=A0A2S3W3V3_9PROT|nr:hypothetical protein [Novacetimonas maltaceti]POF63554.1 hypothetical protein KMAL_07340 [Novacetimonas maltaceti]PYD59827.1 hypothetical protein CFR73_09575 [Novacetimonas maltaceti]
MYDMLTNPDFLACLELGRTMTDKMIDDGADPFLAGRTGANTTIGAWEITEAAGIKFMLTCAILTNKKTGELLRHPTHGTVTFYARESVPAEALARMECEVIGGKVVWFLLPEKEKAARR